MMNISAPVTRRTALLGTAAAAPLALAGCSGLTSFLSSVPQYATDIQTLAKDLSLILPDIKVVTGLSAGAITTIEADITKAKALAAKIGNAAANGASGLVSEFTSIFNSIVSATGLHVPGIVGTVLQAGVALLPQILGAVGLALASPHRPMMSPAQARAVLEAVAKA